MISRMVYALLMIMVTASYGPLVPTSRADEEDAGTQVYQKVLHSCVWIHSPRGEGKIATGTGTLIDKPNRLVLTNYHVVGDNDRCTVLFPVFQKDRVVAERDYYRDRVRSLGIRARVVARDRKRDLAVIQMEELPANAEALPLAPKGASPGQSVQSIGNPGVSGALWVYTPGKVRQVYFKRWRAKLGNETVNFEAEVVETDSATNQGDSGGPLVDNKAQLVGVTQGGSLDGRLVSTFIDLSEVKLFLATKEIRDIMTRTSPPPRKTNRLAVKDDGSFFSPESVKRATEQIQLIGKKNRFDVVVETYLTVPRGEKERVKAMTQDEKLEYYRAWASERISAENVQGLFILVTREPSHLYILVSPDNRSRFSQMDVQAVKKVMLDRFREKSFDTGLLESLNEIATCLERTNK